MLAGYRANACLLHLYYQYDFRFPSIRNIINSTYLMQADEMNVRRVIPWRNITADVIAVYLKQHQFHTRYIRVHLTL